MPENEYMRENRGLAIEIDPSGPAAPIVYRYHEQPGPGACADYNIGYSVRKLRFVSVNNITGGVDGVRPWQMEPLPRPDWWRRSIAWTGRGLGPDAGAGT